MKMTVTILLVLLCFALQEVCGSNNKSQGRLKSWFKKGLAILAVNEVYHVEKTQETDPKALTCRYTIPNKNAVVMMDFITCAKEPDFEKYLIDNSKDCSQIKKLYKEAKSFGKCAYKTPKIIVDGALAKFRGELVRHETNVRMLREYLENIWVDGLIFPEHFVPNKDFDFFRFKRILSLTEILYPKNPHYAVIEALSPRFKDVNPDKVDKKYQYLKNKLWFPISSDPSNLHVHHSQWASDPQRRIKEEQWEGLDVHPTNRHHANALNRYKDANRQYGHTTLKYEPWNPRPSDVRKFFKDAIMKSALKSTYPEVVKEDF